MLHFRGISKKALVHLFVLALLLTTPPAYFINQVLTDSEHLNRQKLVVQETEQISRTLSKLFSDLEQFFIKHQYTQFSCDSSDLKSLRQMLFGLPPVLEIGLVSPSGELYCNTWQRFETPYKFDPPLKEELLRYSGPIFLEYMERSAMVVAKTRPDRSEINAVIPTSWFRKLVRDSAVHNSGYVAIVDSKTAVPVILAGSYTLPLIRPQLYPFDEQVNFTGLFDDGQQKFMSAAPVADLPSLSVITTVDTDEIYADIPIVYPIITISYLLALVGLFYLLVRENWHHNKPERQIEIALEQRQFINHYQPIVNASTGEVYAVEALVRWNHPTEGIIYPGAFIAEAERSDLIMPMALMQIEQAFSELADLLAIYPNMKVSFNICSRHFTSTTFINALLCHPERLSRMILELTERDVFDIELVQGTLSDFKKGGAVIAIDDFGTGYSGLQHLKALPIDVIKIDRCFVAGIEEQAINLSLLSSIIELAKRIGVNVVAEGVETQPQKQHLEALEVTTHQGWLYARAMNIKTLKTWFATNQVQQRAA